MSSKFYNGSTHIFYADDGGDVTLKAGSGNLIIEGVTNNTADLPALGNKQTYIGNENSEAVARTLHGSIEITNNDGTVALSSTGVVAGIYNKIDTITVTDEGRISSITQNDGSISLTQNKILVGQPITNKAAEKTVGGDVSMSSEAIFTLNNISTGGDYYYPTRISIDNKGRTTLIEENGVAENAMLIAQNTNKFLPRQLSGHMTIDRFGVCSLSSTVTGATQDFIKSLTFNNQGRITGSTGLAGYLGNSEFLIGFNSGTDVKKVAMSGDVTMDTNGTTVISNINSGFNLTFPISGLVTNTKGQVTSASSSLSGKSIWIGSTLNRPTARVLSGDITNDEAGVVTLKTVNTANPAIYYDCPRVKVDVKGRVTEIIDGSQNIEFPNLLINPYFQVWQRYPAKSVNMTAEQISFFADRWSASNWDLQGITYSGVTNGDQTNLRIQRTQGNANTAIGVFGQTVLVQNSTHAFGKNICVRAKFRKSANSTTSTLRFTVNQGTGTDLNYIEQQGFQVGELNIGLMDYTFTTNWQEVSFKSSSTFTGTQLSLQVQLLCAGTGAASDYVEFEYITMNAGDFPKVYPKLHYFDELIKCKPYYQYIHSGMGYATSTTEFYIGANYPFEMIRAPVLSGTINKTTGVNGESIIIVDENAATKSQSSFAANFVLTNSRYYGTRFSNFTGLTSNKSYQLIDTNTVMFFDADY